jgi:hypothetical protein
MILDLPNLQQISNTALTLVVHSCDNLGRGICNTIEIKVVRFSNVRCNCMLPSSGLRPERSQEWLALIEC